MITESTLYWITRLDNFIIVFRLLIFLSVAISIFCLSVIFNDFWTDHAKKNATKGIVCSFFVFLFAMSGIVFTPTTKEMCAIKVIPAIANNEKVQGIGDKVLTLTNEWLNGLLEEAKEK